ncbi:GntR family transcriptional regulator [Tepidimonas fonticaldi]|uniref:GntR family transcriptional regulator n=1 Tax=Tepidimonas fonticaldi TaxID=1101373 RepID=A0A1A6DXQ1_9BURK|nr:GntR family transcriptional regulator [Tepidimonas fonticaldi]OBS31456.1 GntR family transcriptional regulator [Tepidimonas fonticaldi]
MTSKDIADRIVEAILAQKLAPGIRLGEQALSMLFDCSRTLVREAMMQLAARGIVTVSARRGWYVVQPSQVEAREAFEARRVIETGLIRMAAPMDKVKLGKLKRHIQQEKAALKDRDVGRRSYLLGDFHVCLAECLGNQLLADTLRDLTARTTLIAMLYQSTHDAEQSCQDHVDIVDALARGDIADAEALMAKHIGDVQEALTLDSAKADPLAELRQALLPVIGDAKGASSLPSRSRKKPVLPDSPQPATYLGALL